MLKVFWKLFINFVYTMKESKKYQLQDLIEKIEKVDEMVKVHASNPSKFMLEQYEAKKEKLLGYLIDELVDAKIRSPYSFKLIILALIKFYPELMSPKNKKDKHYDELKDLEEVLV
jgi:hypothetical protein